MSDHPLPMSAVLRLPWRVGRSVGRTIYAQLSEDPADDDVLIGLMDTRSLAIEVVTSHNAALVQRERAG